MLLIDALAAYRLTRLVTADSITEPLRAAVIASTYAEGLDEGETWDEVVMNDPRPPRLAELVTCRWCAGVWVSFGVVAARRFAPRLWDPIARALAMSAGAALIAGLED